MTVALYARVSTKEQSADRQLSELRERASADFPDEEPREYVDVITGAAADGGEQYQQLRADIAAGELSAVLVHELSRLSRLGAGEIQRFLQHCVEHNVALFDLEVGLELDASASGVDRAVSSMIAGVMGDLARIEHKQKLRRIRSGISAAQEQGKWTGRPPFGFETDDSGRLRVDVERFLTARAAVERVERGESYAAVASDTGMNQSTLRKLHTERSDLYLRAESDDSRVDTALDEIRPLDRVPSQNTKSDREFETRVREIARAVVREELKLKD
jgi:DNA invertase Pin-like site-specific DNA recombinase